MEAFEFWGRARGPGSTTAKWSRSLGQRFPTREGAMQWVIRGFRFDGRIKPREYLRYLFFSIVLGPVGFALTLVAELLADALTPLFAVFALVAFLSAPWIGVAALMKRFRDAGLSFGWFFLWIVPLGGLFIFFLAISAESKNEAPPNFSTSPNHPL